MSVSHIMPANFTPTIGAYSHAVKIDLGSCEMLYTTGQIAMDRDGNVVSDDITEQSDFVFRNTLGLLREAKMEFRDVVKVQIFVTDMNEFDKISAVRNKYLQESAPVSTLVEINKTVKDGCRVELEVTAFKRK